MKVREFDKKFDEGKEDISKYLDISKARRPHQEQKRVNVQTIISFLECHSLGPQRTKKLQTEINSCIMLHNNKSLCYKI
jgi:hypothetical protein